MAGAKRIATDIDELAQSRCICAFEHDLAGDA
jgi:hypothetical protein